MLRFLYHVGQAVAKQGLGDIAKAIADPTLASAANLIGRIGADVWKGLRDDRKQDKLHADILDAARMSFADAKRQAEEIAAKVAPDDPVLRGHVERFVTLVPAAVQASLKRADDPSGTTLPVGYAIEDESDIVKLLPVRFPREHFKPGYAPPFLRGWELVEQIGAGGFGEVWKARSQRANQLVGAVKFGHALSDAELSLLNEGDVLNRLLAAGKHPGIVELQDVWADGDEVPWIRYEYVPGGDLTGLIRKWAALPMAQRLPKVLAAFRELCETVGHFHRLTPSIVHRDLKPSNILVTADGKLKIGDFGIGSVSAKRTLDGERLGTLSRTNTVQAYLRGAHTPLYAPPEQKSDPKHRPAPTDDVHALGVILYQMLTGRLDAAPGARFDRDLTGVPREVIDLIGDCVDGEKSRRPADGGAVVVRAREPEPVALTPTRDYAKEMRERLAREQAEREEEAAADRERVEHEAAAAKRRQEELARHQREREQREAAQEQRLRQETARREEEQRREAEKEAELQKELKKIDRFRDVDMPEWVVNILVGLLFLAVITVTWSLADSGAYADLKKLIGWLPPLWAIAATTLTAILVICVCIFSPFARWIDRGKSLVALILALHGPSLLFASVFGTVFNWLPIPLWGCGVVCLLLAVVMFRTLPPKFDDFNPIVTALLFLLTLAVIAGLFYFFRWVPYQWAALKPGTKAGEEVTLPLGPLGPTMTFCWCPAGTFERGSKHGLYGATPIKTITIGKGFWMAKYETTEAQWAALGFEFYGYQDGETMPVGNIRHSQAVEFADKLKTLSSQAVRLPTEAEWEYACRAGTNTKYWSGDEETDLEAVGWYDKNSDRKLHPVGVKNRPNPWGLHDMHGNVSEFCSDWFDDKYYADSTTNDPKGPEKGVLRVRRGGGSFDDDRYCHAASREYCRPDERVRSYGFRLVVVPSGQ